MLRLLAELPRLTDPDLPPMLWPKGTPLQAFWGLIQENADAIQAVTGVLGAIGVVFSIFLAVSSLRSTRKALQVSAAGNELSRLSMVEELRAWLQINDVRVGSDLYLDTDGTRHQLAVIITARNAGRTPARSATLDLRIHVGLPSSHQDDLFREFHVDESRLADRFGSFLYSGDSVQFAQTVYVTHDDVRSWSRSYGRDDLTAPIFLLGQVSYELAFKNESRSVRFVFQLKNKSRNGIFDLSREYTQDEIFLDRDVLGNVWAD